MKTFKTFFVLVVITITSFALADDGSRITGKTEASPKIINGYDAKPGVWPWMVALIKSGEVPSIGKFCGGTLINSRWILTAAHCVDGRTPDDFYAIAGFTDLLSDSGPGLWIKRIIVHPDYNSSQFDSDFALLELENSATQNTIPIYVGSTSNDNNYTLTGKRATAIGWGNLTSDDYIYPIKLQRVELPIISRETCADVYPSEMTDNMICAGYSAGGTDTCDGDSGGPLMVKISGQWVQAGIVSWGFGCAQAGYYGVYARTAAAMDFFKQYVPNVSTVAAREPRYTLNLNKVGKGSGTIVSTPSGIHCGKDCSKSFSPETVVTLTASSSSPNNRFTGWSGSCSGTGTCQLTMDSNKSVTATFEISYGHLNAVGLLLSR